MTRELSPTIGDCELTHLTRSPIDLGRARIQHHEYQTKLAELGLRLITLPALPQYPDAVFVEDVALVFDELAVLTRPGADSRRGEVEHIAPTLADHRTVVALFPPALLDGGDVLVLGRRVLVGLSRRTNEAGVVQLARLLAEYGYGVEGVRLGECLHLKSAVCALPGEAVLINPRFVEATTFAPSRVLEVDPGEPMAANVLTIGERVIVPAHHPATGEILRRAGFDVTTVAVDELAKAEAGVTCCSLIFSAGLPGATGLPGASRGE